MPIFQIKVTLKDTKPPIWRRLLVPADFTLEKLHMAIQMAMGWTDSHLHNFTIDGETYGNPQEGEISERTAKLSTVLAVGIKAVYTYDFGDDWIHNLTVEKILDPDPAQLYPLCIAGKLRCPPEDCGGPFGYHNLLEALADPDHPEHEEKVDWIGTFDPNEFSVEEANEHLKSLRKKPRSKSAPKAGS
jgi:hypothetical protein